MDKKTAAPKKKTNSAKKPQAKKTTSPAAEEADVESVDKIRDILFGNQMREFDRKYAQLEQGIAGDIESLRKENALQIESLQTFIESEIAILSSKLLGEEKLRIEEMDNLDGELKKSVKQIDSKIADVSKSLDDQSSSINQKILKQSQDFNAEMSSQIEQTRKRMDGNKQELSSGKVDKAALAEMLNSLAMQINGDD